MQGSLKHLKGSKNIFLEGMKKDIQNFVREGQVCIINKREIVKSLGLLQPFHIHIQRLEDISIDFITGLLKYKGKYYIFVVIHIDKFVDFFCRAQST